MLLIGSLGASTLLVVGAGFAVIQTATTLLLPYIQPGQELEKVAT